MAFLQQSDPPPAVLAALSQTHAFLAETTEKDGLCVTEALGAVLGLEGMPFAPSVHHARKRSRNEQGKRVFGFDYFSTVSKREDFAVSLDVVKRCAG